MNKWFFGQHIYIVTFHFKASFQLKEKHACERLCFEKRYVKWKEAICNHGQKQLIVEAALAISTLSSNMVHLIVKCNS